MHTCLLGLLGLLLPGGMRSHSALALTAHSYVGPTHNSQMLIEIHLSQLHLATLDPASPWNKLDTGLAPNSTESTVLI